MLRTKDFSFPSSQDTATDSHTSRTIPATWRQLGHPWGEPIFRWIGDPLSCARFIGRMFADFTLCKTRGKWNESWLGSILPIFGLTFCARPHAIFLFFTITTPFSEKRINATRGNFSVIDERDAFLLEKRKDEQFDGAFSVMEKNNGWLNFENGRWNALSSKQYRPRCGLTYFDHKGCRRFTCSYKIAKWCKF